ncbi:MAG: putative zinc-binding protein [Acidobacteriota bacterium]
MSPKHRVIPVAACSGIGKILGAATREAAYILTEDLRPEKTKVMALGLLVLGDEEARREVEGAEAVAIDGCKLGCAAKGLACSGAAKVHKIAVFDVLRRHRGLKPEGVCDLNEDGSKLARAAAEEAAGVVDGIDGEGGHA